MKAFNKLLISDLRQFFRDRTALFFTFAFPILFIFIFGWVFSGAGDISYEIGLVKNDSSVTSEGISQILRQIPIFEINEGEKTDKLAELEEGNLRAVVVIPDDIDTNIGLGQPVDIRVYYDPAQTTSAQIILPVLKQAIDEVNRQITQQPILVKLTEESIQAHDLRDIDYLVPGILAMSILFLGLFGSIVLVERREKKILKRFGATPLNRSTMVFSQITYRMILALIQTLIIIGIASLVFNVQMVGNWFLLLGLVLLGTLTFISIGYFAVARAKTTEGAMPIIQIIQFPMLFLSGIFFPVDFMPDFMRPIIAIIPLTYLGDAFRQVMVDATPLYPLSLDIAVLIAWLFVCMILAVKLFRWE
ncbi:MAG: ABC transporter permease [Dehalococcoidia bacterium]|nr:MAG: ABC transporter permease [Dehalococcoidia bacterium]